MNTPVDDTPTKRRGYILPAIAAIIGMMVAAPIGAIVSEAVSKYLSSRDYRAEIENDLLRKLPLKVDEVTTLVAFSINERAATYEFRVVGLDTPFDVQRLRTSNLKIVCGAWQEMLRRKVVESVVYKFEAGATKASYTVRLSDC